MSEQVVKAVERARELLGSAALSAALNEDYWKLFTVIAYHYVSDDPAYEVVELYSRDGVVLRVKRDSGGVEWSIYSLHECACACGE